MAAVTLVHGNHTPYVNSSLPRMYKHIKYTHTSHAHVNMQTCTHTLLFFWQDKEYILHMSRKSIGQPSPLSCQHCWLEAGRIRKDAPSLALTSQNIHPLRLPSPLTATTGYCDAPITGHLAAVLGHAHTHAQGTCTGHMHT